MKLSFKPQVDAIGAKILNVVLICVMGAVLIGSAVGAQSRIVNIATPDSGTDYVVVNGRLLSDVATPDNGLVRIERPWTAVATPDNGLVRISSDGSIQTIAFGVVGQDMALDKNGNFVLVVSRRGLLQITPTGQQSWISITQGVAIATDASGNFIVADNIGHAIWRVSPDGSSSVLVATYPVANLNELEDVKVAVDNNGNYIVAEDNGGLVAAHVFRITPDGAAITEVNITGAATPRSSSGLALDGSGNYMVLDFIQASVFKITPAGASTLFAQGLCCNATDLTRNPATGEFAVTSSSSQQLQKISADGSVVSTIAKDSNFLFYPAAVVIITTPSVTPMGGEIDGTVTGPDGSVLSGALVQVCAGSGGGCVNDFTGSSGSYSTAGLSDGTYNITAFPPAGTPFLAGQTTAIVTNASHVIGANIQLAAPTPPPAGTGISPSLSAGVPVVFFGNGTTLSTTGCPNGTATYRIALSSGAVVSQGSLPENPPGSGDYSIDLPPFYPNHGIATVSITINCGNSQTSFSFPIYIDPSGVVKNQFGIPIAGATVRLLSSPAVTGPYTGVANGSAVMSPANRNNPDTTNALGVFGWDVISGFYEVTATAPGCSTATSPALTIPPAVTGIELDLTCAVTAVAPASGNSCNGLFSGTFKGDLSISAGQSCTFAGAGSGVTGSIHMNGGSLTLSQATVGGNLQINGAATFNILSSSTIKGNLEVQNIPGPAGTVLNQICGSTVQGNLQFHTNGTAVQIGANSVACPGNTVTGNMEVHNNSAQTLVFNNSVKGDLQDHNNVTAPVFPATEVIGNLVTGNLQCHNNSSIIGGPNPGSKKIQGDCK